MDEDGLLSCEDSGEDEEDELRQPANDREAFIRIQRKFYKTVNADNEAEDDPLQIRFLENYTKLFNFLRATRERAMEVDNQRSEVAEALAVSEERLNDCLQLIACDAGQIDELNNDISTSHKLIENAEAREQAAQEVIDSLRKTIANLNADIDMKNKMAQAELEENPQAAKHREAMEREKTKLISEMSKLSEKLNNALAYQEELERRMSLTDTRINDISTQLEETQVEVEKYTRARQKIESDVADYSDEVERRSAEAQVLQGQMRLNQRLIARFGTQLKEQVIAAQKCARELGAWQARVTRMHTACAALEVQAEALRLETVAGVKALRDKDVLRIRLQIDVTKVVKEREQVDRRARFVEETKMSLLDEAGKLRGVVVTMRKELELNRIEADHSKALIEERIGERDLLNRNLLRRQAVGRDHVKVMKVQEQTRKRLDREIDERVVDMRRQGKQIYYVEKERDRLLEEALDKTRRTDDAVEEMRQQRQFLADVGQVLATNDAKYRSKQGQLDAVRAARNALQKQMQQHVAEANDMKERLMVYHRQTEQLKESIGAKDVELVKSETIRRKLIKERDNVKIELNNSLDWVHVLKKEIADTTAEEARLAKVIEDSERFTKEQARMITTLVSERDVLGSQLVRRNDEISLANEKIGLLLTTLHVGEAQYEARLDDIRLLKVEIKRLRQESCLLQRSIVSMDNFKVTVFHLERELTKERMNSKALEEELHNPMNVHRWRRLSGSDPEMSELLAKTSKLQKRLMKQAVALIDVEKQLAEAENLYMNLRILLSKQPGAQVQQALNKAQKCLFKSTVRNKCLISELNMLEVNKNQCTKNLARAVTQLRDVKTQLRHEKRMLEREKRIVVEGKVLIAKLKGAVEMPKLPERGNVEAAMSVSSLFLSRRRN